MGGGSWYAEASGDHKPCNGLFMCWKKGAKYGKAEEGSGAGDSGGDMATANLAVVGRRKPGGWKTMPFILGNETCERLASYSLLANFMVYLLREYHMNQASAANLINVWSGFANFAPLIGAFLADAYFGRFWVIGLSSFASFMGILTLTLTAWIPGLKPRCSTTEGQQQQQLGQCIGPNLAQLGFLIGGLAFLAIGGGGIRPCSIPFGVDQFDFTTEKGTRGISSYYNWYYTTLILVVMVSVTVMVYIQDHISWVLGFGIPVILMLGSIIIFFLGKRLYIFIKPEGSVFSSIVEVLVVAHKKRNAQLPDKGKNGAYYDPPLKGIAVSKLQLTNEYSFLNKAAMILEGDLNPDGTCSSKWKISSIQRVEEVKCLIRVLPIWISGIICLTVHAQQSTFTVSQALNMQRHLGSFEIPAGSIWVVTLLTVGVLLPIYDRLMVPMIRRVTKIEGGITHLQRMGIGLFFAIATMVVSGLVEEKRRKWALSRPSEEAPLSVFWLVPQLVLMGLLEGFNFIAQIEFYNKEFPENMRSVATALFFCSIGGANYLGSLLIMLVHGLTGDKARRRLDWLANDLNKGRLDYFYYLLAAMAGVDMFYFLYISRRYKYKGAQTEEKVSHLNDVEMNLSVK